MISQKSCTYFNWFACFLFSVASESRSRKPQLSTCSSSDGSILSKITFKRAYDQMSRKSQFFQEKLNISCTCPSTNQVVWKDENELNGSPSPIIWITYLTVTAVLLQKTELYCLCDLWGTAGIKQSKRIQAWQWTGWSMDQITKSKWRRGSGS